jgi:homocysteine S-methyltransferase
VSKYRQQLPQLGNDLFLADGGQETTLVFHEGMDLPCFAAFDLLKDEDGIGILRHYFDSYLSIARERSVGAVLEAPTDLARQPELSDAAGLRRSRAGRCKPQGDRPLAGDTSGP